MTDWTKSCTAHSSCQPHPLFSYFGSPNPPHGWILVVGREPNANACMDGTAGPYHLRSAGPNHVQFWIRSHRRLSCAARIWDVDLLSQSCRLGCSPIAYTDASPRGRLFGGGPHSQLSRSELEQHAADVLALPQLRERRCPVVVISGRMSGYAAFYDYLVPRLRALGIAVADNVPFFGQGKGNENVAIMAQLEEPCAQSRIHDVVRSWAASHDILCYRNGEMRVRKPPTAGHSCTS